MICPQCGAQLSENAGICQQCGAPRVTSDSQDKKVAVVLLLIVAAFIAVAAEGVNLFRKTLLANQSRRQSAMQAQISDGIVQKVSRYAPAIQMLGDGMHGVCCPRYAP